MQQNSTATEFIVSVTLDLHNTHVYCKAYNLEPQNESVMSNIVLLNVEGKYECTQLLFRYNNNWNYHSILFCQNNAIKKFKVNIVDSGVPVTQKRLRWRKNIKITYSEYVGSIS